MNALLSRGRLLGTMSALGLNAEAAWARRATAAENYTMRLSIPTSIDNILGAVALRFARGVNARSNGQVKVDVYPSAQISREQEAIDNLVSGVLDFSVGSSSFLSLGFPRFQVFDVPFLFRDLEAGYRVVNGPIGAELFADLEPRGIVGLCFGSSGVKQIDTVSRVIVTPDDMKGMRMRVQAGAVFAATYQALGAIPITIDASEMFTALTQRTIEGIDLGFDTFYTNKLYTICKHIALTNHVFSTAVLIGSRRKIEALPSNLQRIIKEEGRATNAFWHSTIVKLIAVDVESLKKNGVIFNETKRELFRKAVEPVYGLVQAKIGADLIERVARAAS